MKLLQALRNATRHLAADFEDSKLFEHRGEKGQFREQIIAKLLKPFLPECYGIGTGQIFSDDGQSSRQIDIVLYDSIFSNVLFRDAQSSLFPCESIYGTIEVKSNLTKAELLTSIQNIASVKNLPRRDSTSLDILPTKGIRIGAGLSKPTQKLNTYLGVVFAYESISMQSIVDALLESIRQKEIPPAYFPDFIFSFKQGFMVCKSRMQDGEPVPVPLGYPFNAYGMRELGTDTLPFFYLMLNTILNELHLKAPDFNKYLNQVYKDAGKVD